MKTSSLLFMTTGILLATQVVTATVSPTKTVKSKDANSTAVIINNNIAPIQIGATIYDNGGKMGHPTINIWPPHSQGSGTTVNPGGSYNSTVANGTSASFGVQVNSARIPTGGGQCYQLCDHIKIAISKDGSTCTAMNDIGTCGTNQNAPRWSATLNATMKTTGICTVNITNATTPPIVCGCQWGAYPCPENNVVCGPGTKTPTCPQQPPYNW